MAVKKALLGVSGCLQECPVVDKSTVKESRPLESAACPAGPDLRVAPLQFTALSEATDSSGSAFAGRPLSLDANKHSASDPTTQQQQEVVFKILCSNDRVGGVIGRGGSIVKALQERTGATISAGAPIADCNERVVTITSTEVCWLLVRTALVLRSNYTFVCQFFSFWMIPIRMYPHILLDNVRWLWFFQGPLMLL